MTPTLGLGLAGAGRFGAFLAAAVADLPGLQVQAVADPDQARATELAAAHGARATPTWQDLLADDRVDVVAVVTPPRRHAEVALAALAAGKHVFCEKPLATTVGRRPRAWRPPRPPPAARSWSTTCSATTRCCQALVTLQDELLGPVQRFAFENDASDEDLAAGPLVLGRGDQRRHLRRARRALLRRRAPAARHARRVRVGDRRPPRGRHRPTWSAPPRCTPAARSPPTPTGSATRTGASAS